MMNLPRVLDSSGNIIKIIHPIRVSLNLNIVPLSYASIRLSKNENLPARGLVELFSPYGSVGVFRVRNPHDAYGDEMTTAELEHSIAEVGDYIVKEKIDEMISANSAMTRIFKHYKGKLWQLGSVSALGSDKVAVSINYNRVLDSMLAILEQKPDCMMAFNFATNPWTVSIVKKGTEVTAEGRLTRNVTSATVSYDDTELCTRVWYESYTKKNGEVTSSWKSKDADTIGKYGVIERDISTSSDMTTDEINTVVNTFLSEHKKPRVSVSIEGVELSQITGESMDKISLGKMYRLVIPEYNVVVEDIVVGLSWDDLYNKPMDIFVNVGDQEDTVVTFLHNLDAKGSGGGGGGGGKKKEEEEKWKEYKTNYYKDDYRIDLNAQKVDRANNILKQAGLEINASGVLVYSTDNERNLASMIKTQADRISLVVSGSGPNAKVKRASIVAAINNGKSSVVISADNINLSGYTTLEKFNGLRGTVNNLVGGLSTFTTLRASQAYLGASGGGSVHIYGQTVRIYTVTDKYGTDRHVFGYS